MRTLKRATEGHDVKAWQEFLIEHGHLASGNNTGTFGPKTEQATRAFQQQQGLGVDGIAGAKTLAAALRLGFPDQQSTVRGEEHLRQVHPELQRRIRVLIETVARRSPSITSVVVSGCRSFAEQAALYAKGRTAPGPKVTNAPPVYSYHNHCLAVDLASLRNGKTVWDVADARIRGEVGRELGLEMGVFWSGFVDPPHAQLTAGLSIAECVALNPDGRNVRAVWAEVDRRLASKAPLPPGDQVEETCEHVEPHAQ